MYFFIPVLWDNYFVFVINLWWRSLNKNIVHIPDYFLMIIQKSFFYMSLFGVKQDHQIYIVYSKRGALHGPILDLISRFHCIIHQRIY